MLTKLAHSHAHTRGIRTLTISPTHTGKYILAFLITVGSSSCAESGNHALKKMLRSPRGDAVVPSDLNHVSVEELTARVAQYASSCHAEIEQYEEM